MRTIVILAVVLSTGCLCFAEKFAFDNVTVGLVPPGWTVAMTHEGGAPKWAIVKDPSAPSGQNVFAQVSQDGTNGRYPLAICDKVSVSDGTLSVKFKTVSGTVDQAAGLVWRYQDPDNYYIVRANALEDNVVLYRVEKGKRISLAPKFAPSETYGVQQRVPKETWNSLGVTFQGRVFTVSFNGQAIFEVEDGTFASAGRSGLWTKADSVICFDDFQIEGK